MKRFLQYTAGLIICIFFSVGVWGQTTLVEWNFPNNPDDATADGGIAANSAKTITSIGTGTVLYSGAGATTNCAAYRGWDSGSGTKYWQIEFSTTGYQNLTFSSKQTGNNDGSPRDFKVQYKVGALGIWTDVAGTSVTCVLNNWTSGALTNISLPAACDDQSSIYLRWIMTSNTSIGGSTIAANRYSGIDDVIIKGTALPSCTPPSTQATIGAYTNNTTGTTLTANWTRGNGDNILVVARLTSTSAVAPSSGTTYTANAAFGSGNTTGTGNFVVYNGTGTSVNVTALTASTSYTFDIYEYSNTGVCYKTPASSLAVTTFGAVSYCNNNIGDGYYYIDDFSTTNATTNITNNNTSADPSGYGDYTSLSASAQISATVNFYIGGGGGSHHFGIWIDWNQDGDFSDANEEVFLNNSSYEFNETGSFTIPVSATIGSTRMRVVGNGYGDASACVNDEDAETEDYTFIVAPPPTCPAPSTLAAGSITATQASLSWTENGTATSWDIELGLSGFSPTGTPTQAGVANPYTYTGLSASLTYEYYVRADCGSSDYSTWFGPYEFTTACGTVTPTYTENFTSYLPNCWSETTGTLSAPSTLSGSTSSWSQYDFANNSSNTNSANLNICCSDTYDWLISPSVDLGDGSINYQLEFDLALTAWWSTSPADTDGTDDKFAVVISTDDGATWTSANTLMLWDNAGSPNVYNNISTTGEHITIDLTSFTGTVKIGLYGESTVSNADNDLFIDNFKVIEIPTCPQPISLGATNILPNQADLTWTEFGSATLWDIEGGIAGFSPTGTPTYTGVANPYTITGLTASTNYEYYVRADCGGGDFSEWSGPYSFTTAAPYMTYTSSTTTQTVTTDVSPSSTNQQVIGIQVVTTGTTSPISITSFDFDTDGTTSPGTDVLNAKLWYTGTSATFATTTQFGSTTSGPNGVFTISGTQTLASGTNYFWLTYDLATGATINNYIDAECNQITVAAANQTPTDQDPAGRRQIKDIYLISDPTLVSACSGSFYDSGGSASNYSLDEDYTKTFSAATPGSALQFVFASFATESSYDELTIYDGPNDSYPVIGVYSGTTSPGTITSSGQFLTFNFYSDDMFASYAGWEASISCVPITVPDCITYNTPADTEVDVCPGSVNLSWTGASTGFYAEGYKVYFGTDNPPTNLINGLDVGAIESYEAANLDANTTYYWRIAPYNTAGTQTGCGVQSFTTLNLGISGTTGLTTCDNTGNISATGNGTITWYDVPTGGSPIGTGSPLAVTFSGNTTYYVAAESSGGGTENGGRTNAVGADGSFITTDWGIMFDATEDFTLVSTKIYPVGTGTVTIALLNDAGTEIASTSAINVTGTGLSTPVVIPLGFGVTVGSNYKIVVKAYTGITGLIRDFSSPFPYPSPSGAIDVTAGWSGSSTTAYYWFYDIVITGGSCVSARIPVEVVHTAEPITITPDGPTTFLDGNSVGLTASSAEIPAYTYTWSPATGLNTTTGATVIASPNVTTTYTVTGTNGSCTNTEEITITVTYPCSGLGTGHTPISSLPFNETSTTCGGVDDITSSNAIVCSSSSYYTGEDVVYSFTPSIDGLVTIDLTSTGTFTGIMLYEGCPMNGQGGSCLAYRQSSAGNESLCINLQQDITYYLVIDSYDSPDCNPYTINISAPDPVGVENDFPCAATPIAIGGLQAGDNSCSSGTDEPTSASCWTTGTLNTVWYSFDAPASGSVKIRTTLGTLTATQIAVYQGNCDNLTIVANSCNTDATGVCSGSTQNSSIELTGLTSGNTYYIRIDGEYELTGDFDLEVIDGINNWPYVPQQDCGSATLICNQQTIVGDPGFLGAGSTCDYSTPYGCFSFGTQNNTVWYQIDIAANGTLVFDITPNLSTTDYDWALVDVTSNPTACDEIAAGTLSPIRCNFSGTSGTTGLRSGYSNTSESAGGVPFCSPLTVNAGDSYQLLIWNWSGNNTGFNLDMQATSPVNYSSPTSLTWSGGASSDWFDPINWGGCAIPDCGIDVIIVNGPTNQPIINADGAECKSISIESGASLTINAARTLTVCDDFSNIGTLNIDPTATILLNDNGADHEFDGSLTGANAIGNLSVNKLSGSVTFLQDIEIQGDLSTANATSIIDVNGKNVIIGGDFEPWDATYTNIGTGRLTFNGSVLQAYNPGGLVLQHDVTINNTGGGLVLSRNLELNATGELNLTNGVINTNSNGIIINNTAPDAVNTGNSNSYILGDLRRYFASNAGVYSFPMGTATAYRLAQITNNNLSGITYIDASFSDSFTVGTISASDLGTPYSSVATEGIWTLTPDAQPSAGDYSVLLHFNDGGAGEAYSLSDNMFAPLKRLNSSQAWTTGGGTINASSTLGRTVAGGFARRIGLTDFSEFAIAKSNTILPITLIEFGAKCDDENIAIYWTTAQEINNSHFSLMKSQDGRSFYPIAKIDGAGNSEAIINYSHIDKFSASENYNYYKLVQTDFDGTETESKIINIICVQDETITPLSIYNSINSEYIEIQFFVDSDTDSQISVFDNLGRLIYQNQVNPYFDQNLNIDKKQFAPGIYNISVRFNDQIFNDKFVIVK
ncbi:MAG: hypothetical protein JXR36_06175 [Bacteroidales bacterium]|nr:hypothetical protein [Bacteroidales bacterium]